MLGRSGGASSAISRHLHGHPCQGPCAVSDHTNGDNCTDTERINGKIKLRVLLPMGFDMPGVDVDTELGVEGWVPILQSTIELGTIG
jgi:hypothetical protein